MLLVAFCFVSLGRRLGVVEKSWALASVRFEFKFWLCHFLAAGFALFLHLLNKDGNMALQGGCENNMN